jgi:ribonuclease E
MLIDASHPEETRVVVVDGTRLEEFDFETASRKPLKGNIYLAKVIRIEPSLQAAFVEYGGNRHGFLAFSEIHPDYYQIPKADREALLAEEAELARQAEDETPAEKPKARGRSRSRSRAKVAAESTATDADATVASDPLPVSDIGGDFADAPPPSAASGEVEIDVPDEPAPAPEGEEYEAVGGDDLAEERSSSRRTPRARRYKIQEVDKVRQILLVQVV